MSNFTIQEQTVTFFNQFIKPGDFIKDFEARHGDAYDYREYDHLNVFTGTHPEAIQQAVKAQDWEFIYDPSKNNMNRKEKIMKFLEMLTGKQFFIYTNYKVLKG